MNTAQAPNLVRSAIAPLISATVMTANVSWKAENMRSGMPAHPGRAVHQPVLAEVLEAADEPVALRRTTASPRTAPRRSSR